MSRLVLVGCGKSKSPGPARVRDFYTGNLFAARRTYAEATGAAWFVVSARHGLVDPSAMLEPYDVRVSDLTPKQRASWALDVASALLDLMPDTATVRSLREVNVELHLGAEYADALEPALLAAGFSTSRPVEGLGVGEQLAWYKGRRGLEAMRL